MRLSNTLQPFHLIAFCFAFCLGIRADLTFQPPAVINEAAELRIPPKPEELIQVPLAKVDAAVPIPSASDLQPAMASYMTELFSRAKRPRITEGDQNEYWVRATLVTAPQMEVISRKGSKFDPRRWKMMDRFVGGWKEMTEMADLSFDSTNIVAALRCSVEVRLLDQSKEVIGIRKIDFVRTNNLRALSVELQGFRAGAGSSENLAAAIDTMNGHSMRQATANITLYHAVTNILTIADLEFLKKKPVVTVVTNSLPSTTPKADEEWVSIPEAAEILKTTEAEVRKAVDENLFKSRKVGSAIRIRKADLN